MQKEMKNNSLQQDNWPLNLKVIQLHQPANQMQLDKSDPEINTDKEEEFHWEPITEETTTTADKMLSDSGINTDGSQVL